MTIANLDEKQFKVLLKEAIVELFEGGRKYLPRL
jgi:hypothetical protein